MRPLAAGLLALLASCSTLVEDVEEYTFVLLQTGPVEGLTDAEQGEAFAGHFANMQRLAEEGTLCFAGPIGDPDRRLRGLFLLDVADTDEAAAITRTDPTVELGIFEPAHWPLRTAYPFREMLAREMAIVDAGEEPAMRAYVLAFGRPASTAVAQLRRADVAPRVVVESVVDADEELAVAVLDCESAEEAAALLDAPDAWEVYALYGTATLATLRAP